jgi:two-component system response regulator
MSSSRWRRWPILPRRTRIHVARNGVEALDFLSCSGSYTEGPLELFLRAALLDWRLPLVSGVEVLGRVKSDPRAKPIPAVILTTSREDRDPERCCSLGVNSYIVKPVRFDRFVEAVKMLEGYWLGLNETHGSAWPQ